MCEVTLETKTARVLTAAWQEGTGDGTAAGTVRTY